MKFEDMKKDIPETPEFIHTMIQNEVKKQLQDTQVVHIQKRKKNGLVQKLQPPQRYVYWLHRR